MVWRRLPALFPNIRLYMLPVPKDKLQQIQETGWLREVAFRTDPSVNKAEIKEFLQAVHGMEVERVHTINYQGKKKRHMDMKGRVRWYRRTDWKKAYVLFKPPIEVLQQWQAEQAAQYNEQLQRHLESRRQQPARLRAWRQQQQLEGLPDAAARLTPPPTGSTGSNSSSSSGSNSSSGTSSSSHSSS